ncbi:MAG: hypothetical protein IKC73_03650 [Clostridia bacterium]|nr:hypothetical protein [Clostridia bacterium]
MKGRLFALVLLLLLAGLLFPLSTSAKSPEEELGTLFEGLPPSVREALPSDPTDAAALSESVGVHHLFEVVLSSLSGAVPRLLATLATLLGVTLFFALLAAVREGLGAGTARAAEAALGLALVLCAYGRFLATFERAAAYLSDLATLASAAAPVMSALYLAGGNTAAALSGSGAMAALALLLSRLTGGALLPLLRVMLGFLLVSAIGEVRTEGVVTTLRGVYTTALGLFTTLTSAALALGNALGAARDTLGLRSLRFAVGSMIPMVGGAVSGGLSTLAAGLSLIRATAGIGLAAAILLTFLPILVELLLSRLVLSLLASLAGLVGAPTALRLFRSFRALFDLSLAAVAFSSMLFILIAAVFARCAPAIA